MNAALLDAPEIPNDSAPPKITPAKLTRSQVIARGKALYETSIKPLVEPEHIGKSLSIHVLSGAYQIHETLPDVTVYENSFPNGTNAVPPRFLMRIGYTAAFKRSRRAVRITPVPNV